MFFTSDMWNSVVRKKFPTVPGMALPDVGYELLTAVLMKSSTRIFWDMTPCSTFRGNISPPFSGLENKQTRALIVTFHASFLFGLFFYSEDGPPKHLLMFSGMHGVISEKIDLFKFSHV
jgi:hypothetical protein